MRTVVVDATVLIYLAKLGELDLLETLFEAVFVPDAVYEEVVERGQAEGYRDALAVAAATDDDLDVIALSDDLVQAADRVQETAGLGRGEAATIALARRRGARCLTDDHAARTTAESLDVEVGGTVFVLLEALADGQLTADTYVTRIDELSDSGFRMSAALYRRAIEAGEKIDSE